MRMRGKLAEYQSIRFVAILFGGADIVIQTLHTTLDELHEFVQPTPQGPAGDHLVRDLSGGAHDLSLELE